MRAKLALAAILFCVPAALPPAWAAAGETPVFATWEGMEADKCASIWLIRRFIAPHAEIRFQPRGEPITQGTAFDTPDARFRRFATRSTFESLAAHYELRDPKIAHIGRVIHDIEVNVWEHKLMKESVEVESAVRVIGSRATGAEAIAKCLHYFDRFYRGL